MPEEDGWGNVKRAIIALIVYGFTMAMEKRARGRVSARRAAKTFSTRQYKKSPASVIAHARRTGHAIVVNKSGRTTVAIDIPKKKLPAAP